MQIIQPGVTMDTRRVGKFSCTGVGNGNNGCGAVLELSEDDLYGTYNSCMGRFETYFVTFMCPCCGSETDLANSDGYRNPDLPKHYRAGAVPHASTVARKAALKSLKAGKYVSPRAAQRDLD